MLFNWGLKWLAPSPPPGPCSKSPPHRSSLARLSKAPFILPPPAPEGSSGHGRVLGPAWDLAELGARARLTWSRRHPAHHLWGHSPVSLFPRGQCSLSPDRQAQKDSGGHWSLAPSTAAAALSRRGQAGCVRTPTWPPGRNRRFCCKGSPPPPWGSPDCTKVRLVKGSSETDNLGPHPRTRVVGENARIPQTKLPMLPGHPHHYTHPTSPKKTTKPKPTNKAEAGAMAQREGGPRSSEGPSPTSSTTLDSCSAP